MVMWAALQRRGFRVEALAEQLGSSNYARVMAHRLVQRGKLFRVRRGVYRPTPATPGTALEPGDFLAFRSAAELHGLHAPGDELLVGTSRRRRGAVVAGRRARFVVATTEDVERTTVEGAPVRVTSLERTMLDALDRPELSGGFAGARAIVSAGMPRADPERLLSLLRRRPRATCQRLGFLAERAGVLRPELLAALERLVAGAVRVTLAPRRSNGTRGPVDPRWRIIQNVALDERESSLVAKVAIQTPDLGDLAVAAGDPLDVFLL